MHQNLLCLFMGTPTHVCTLTIYTQRHKVSTSLTPQSAAGFHDERAPAESVDRSRMHTVKGSLHLSLPLQSRARCTARDARKEEKMSERRQRSACHKDGAPDVKDNRITAPLSLSITRDTRVEKKKKRSNEGHISCYAEAMPIRHFHNINAIME